MNEISRYLGIVGCLSFASGLCFVLSGSTLIVFLNDQKLSLAQIGLFLIAHLPHVFKWVAVPWMEKIKHKDHRKWLLQVCIILKSLLFLLFSLAAPLPWVWFFLLLSLHLVSATYECILYISQVVGLKRSNWGFGEAAGVTGYRCGILAGGAGALALSTAYSWNVIYEIYAVVMLLPLIPLYFSKIAFTPKKQPKDIKTLDYLKKAWKSLSKSESIWWLILMMFFFRAQDAMQGQYVTIYLIDLGFDRNLISFSYKTLGLIMATCGGFVAAWIIRRKGIFLPLWIGLITHSVSTLLLVLCQQSVIWLYSITIFYEFTKGLSITPFLSLQIMSCTKTYGMAQIAGLSSIGILSMIFFGILGAQFIEHLGWNNFWPITILSNIPAILLLNIKRKN